MLNTTLNGATVHPPLQLEWRTNLGLEVLQATETSLFGISSDGRVIALDLLSGTVRWESVPEYVASRLAVYGNNLYVYHPNSGLTVITDQGDTYSEQLVLSFTLPEDLRTLSNPVLLGDHVHFVAGDRLQAVDASAQSVAYQVTLGSQPPYSLLGLGQDLVVVSGAGLPSRYSPGSSGYTLRWSAGVRAGSDLAERPVLVFGSRLFVGTPEGVSAYQPDNGALLWSRSGVGNLALAAMGGTLFCGGQQAAMWALDPASGAEYWNRKFLAFVTETARVGLVATDEHVWVGATLRGGAEPAALWAVKVANGQFEWQATGVSQSYGNGLPLLAGTRMLTFGTAQGVACMSSLNGTPAVQPEHLAHLPNPLSGPMSGFNPAQLTVQLSVAARISFVAWHERDQRGSSVGPIFYNAGTHTISYDARWPRGWTDINQFGRLAVDVEEAVSGLRYTQVLLIPVNTLPDIHYHWAKQNIETMIYHRYVGGYPDQTFRPEALVTRAESSTIIAKTLGLSRPSPGFSTRFTDIATHWARHYIMALEEQGVIGGFQEPDGTFTFRPDLTMTRGQKARILVRAYSIAAAPPGFVTRFSDIGGHWAKADIEALEYAGFVSGFREVDGTFTYRPEQNLNRAELCTLVVRIRHLARP